MEHVAIAIHIFLAVLILGTMWRIVSFHLMANPDENLAHIGKAMSLQY